MSISNKNTVTMTAVQCRMARAALGFGIRDIAKLAKVSPSTIARLEAGEELMPRTIETVQQAFEAVGIEFTNGDALGVRLKPLKRKKR
jgi:transcriptional regulator with XRE-family HTH domain